MECRRKVKGKIIWDDDNNAMGIRPSNVEISLFKDGVLQQTIEQDAEREGYAFECYPTRKNDGQAFIYAVETQVPYGYSVKIDGLNIVFSLARVYVTYVFNNIVHRDYTGKVYTQQTFDYPMAAPVVIKTEQEMYPEYTGDCEFVSWNSSSSGGGGVYYEPGSSVMLTENLTLYAIWRSCPPVVNPIYAADTIIRGSGVVSQGGINSAIYASFPNGSVVATSVYPDGQWALTVPPVVLPLQEGAIIDVTQNETAKQGSSHVYCTVLP